jgi:soluble lytic murein transglycosylase-like protein
VIAVCFGLLGPGSPALAVDELPQVLAAEDMALYREIFELQREGRWAEADRQIAKLDDLLLLGHLQFQRYMHPTAYRSRYDELRDWLATYGDHPGAERIHRLAQRRRPSGAAPPPLPRDGSGLRLNGVAQASDSYRSPQRRSRKTARQVRDLEAQVRRAVLRGRFDQAEGLLAKSASQALLDPAEVDQARAKIAAGRLYAGQLDRAYGLAAAAAERSGAQVPRAYWIAGLAAWRRGEVAAAATAFEALATSPRAIPARRAAGAYWAARLSLRREKPQEMSGWLRRAAAEGQGLYGRLAREALGQPAAVAAGFDEAATLAALLEEPAARRAAALLQLDQDELAEAELRQLDIAGAPEKVAGLLLLAERAGLAAFAYHLAGRLAVSDLAEALGPALAVGLYPRPPWQPRGGFRVDRALLYAMVRQESEFDPDARSPSGALGLMQLLPSTAAQVAEDRGLRGARKARLYDPALNLELGQRYVLDLLAQPGIDGDLLRLLVAYNAGPGNLRKWQSALAETGLPSDDPLLFMESLPSQEARMHLTRVLKNLWSYRSRLDQPAPSRAALAAGAWPRYQAEDLRTANAARRNEG